MAELISIGNTQADSADFTVAAGAPKTLYIKSTSAGPCHDVVFLLQHKQSDGATYQTIAELDTSNIRDFGNVVGIGTFRVRRQASITNSAGMDIEG